MNRNVRIAQADSAMKLNDHDHKYIKKYISLLTNTNVRLLQFLLL